MTELRSWPKALFTGWRKKCPACGKGAMFQGYITVVPRCAVCNTELSLARADDAPPYFTMMIVGHVVVPGLWLTEKLYAPALWIQAAFWLPATLFLTLALLPRVKGAIVGLQWALRMHGFGTEIEFPHRT